MARRQVGQLHAPALEEGVGANEQCVWALARNACEGRIDLAAGAGAEHLDLQPHVRAAASTSRKYIRCNRSVGRIDEHGHTNGAGHQLAQQFQPLCYQLSRHKIDACRVAARPGNARDKTKPDRVVGNGEDDGDRRGCRLGRGRRRRADRDDHGNLAANQIGRQRR